MDNKIAQKEQKFYDCLFLDVEIFFSSIEKFLKSQMKKMKKKEREYESIWKFINNFKVKDSFSEELKIVMAVVFIMVFAFWINDKSAIPVAHSDESIMTNAQSNSIDIKEIELNEKKADIKTANEYKIESSEESCKKDKDQKRSSDLCGKDDEELVNKIEREKLAEINKLIKRVVVKAPAPYVFAVIGGKRVCNKKNDHPSKSGNNKKGHMDMECCLDPDEVPNPNCYYNPAKYGKYL